MAEFSNAENSHEGDCSWHAQTNIQKIKEELSALQHVKNAVGEYTLVLGHLCETFHLSDAMASERRLKRIMSLLWVLRYHLFLTSFIAAFHLRESPKITGDIYVAPLSGVLDKPQEQGRESFIYCWTPAIAVLTESSYLAEKVYVLKSK